MPRGHTTAASVEFRGRPVVEYQRLFVLDTTFLKLRVTVPQARWPRTDLDDAARAILEALH